MTPTASPLDVAALKADFPILSRTVRNGRRLVYLDSGATSQKPRRVLDAERNFYEQHNAVVHRGAHQLAEEATDLYESARERVAHFVGAEASEIVFTKNATESINLVAYAFSNVSAKHEHGVPASQEERRFLIGPGDEVVVTEMEHHANLIPWQELCAKTGATLRWIGLTDDGRLDLTRLQEVITERAKVVSAVHQSNILGTINSLQTIGERARQVSALFVVDACQSIPNQPFDVWSSGADVVAWSGHKMLGPTGVGCLWGRPDVLDAMPPFLTGGSMIEMVRMEGSTYAPAPTRFEAGVPMTAQAVGLGAAVDYLSAIGMDRIEAHEHYLTGLALDGLATLPGVRIVGPSDTVDRGGAISFTVDGVHPHDVGQLLDDQGVAVRTGHHCAWPVVRRYGLAATTRATFYLYNDEADVEALIEAVASAQRFFKVA